MLHGFLSDSSFLNRDDRKSKMLNHWLMKTSSGMSGDSQFDLKLVNIQAWGPKWSCCHPQHSTAMHRALQHVLTQAMGYLHDYFPFFGSQWSMWRRNQQLMLTVYQIPNMPHHTSFGLMLTLHFHTSMILLAPWQQPAYLIPKHMHGHFLFPMSNLKMESAGMAFSICINVFFVLNVN